MVQFVAQIQVGVQQVCFWRTCCRTSHHYPDATHVLCFLLVFQSVSIGQSYFEQTCMTLELRGFTVTREIAPMLLDASDATDAICLPNSLQTSRNER